MSCTVALAQTNFRPGYVLPLSGDTLRGEVDSRGAQRNARLARFRASEGAPITEYQPRQLRGYGFNGDRVYQTETVLLADSVGRPSLLDAPADTIKRPSFLEVIVRGSASLLYLRDQADKDHYYLLTADAPVQELLQSTRRVVENGVTYQRKSDEFRYVLAAATKQCLVLQPSINSIRYGLNELASFVRRYNDCVGAPSATPASKSHQNRVQLGFVVGGETSQLVLNENYPGKTITFRGNSAIQPVLGVAFNLRLIGFNRTLSARVETLYESQRYEPKYRNATGFGREYRAKLTGIRVPVLVCYTYPRGRIQPFLQVGYSFNHLLKADNEARNVYPPTTGTIPPAPWTPVVESRRFEQGLVGGVGLTTARPDKRNVAASVRYERSDGFSDILGFGSRVNRLYVLLSYDLTR
ncbi:hypothetical protein [Hymenobacter sp. YC55]|uniref:hypothetical protein n=1 Tax=Hymenobacter sp. YC55 TaxID=3034019 RepID=UPI0023F7C028|nr:hypothetical protein [Hymenobacter sp. YC55]MDF7813468.1 hypothetical protein [Hymenobacter sp. YC55]